MTAVFILRESKITQVVKHLSRPTQKFIMKKLCIIIVSISLLVTNF